MKNLHRDLKDLTLGHLLGHVSRLVGKRQREKFVKLGLFHAQAMVLFRLWQEEGVPQRLLARDLHVSAPTASNTLKRMERDSWIRRERDPEDQRIVRVYLTEKSRHLYVEAHDSLQELDQELASILSEKERGILRESLIKVHQYLFQTSSPDSNTIQSPISKKRSQQ